ncbi:MAG: signal recognition particle protein [Candidatus Competibacterales bacterium]
MFENLSERLLKTVKHLRGQGRLTEDNIKDALRDVRMALLEADVALPVVRTFIAQVKERALGQEVAKSLQPGQVLIKIVHDELVKLMGEANAGLNLKSQGPAVVLMAGLQGSGKTTSSAKLARWLKESQGKAPLLVSCDVYRPAAIDQLKTLANQIQVEWFASDPSQKPVAIAKGALEAARRGQFDVLIVDTAGRLAIDEAMMAEIKELHASLNPVETLFVVDSMTGQDAATTAKAFDEALALTGVVLTKADGDARGGAALSVRHITGKPIKFIGTGEKTQALEPFHPERIADRILGKGDIVSLVEQVQSQVDQQKAEKIAKKLQKGKGFTLEDLKEQMEQMSKLGDMGDLLGKIPGMGGAMAKAMDKQDPNKEVRRMVAIINSMTPQERRFPDVIKGSRKRRIAAGSGTQVQDVNRLLKQYTQMQKMMKQMKKGGMEKMMRGLQGRLPPGMGGGLPPGMGGL